MDLSRRFDGPEWMDTISYPDEVVRETLDFLALTNRWFGGNQVVLSCLDRWTRRWPRDRTLRILDVGTGGGDIPRAMVRWARERGISLSITALDLMPEIAAIAGETLRDFPEARAAQGDLFDLAGREERFDVVTASLFLHHVPPEKTLDALRALDRLARRGVIVSDLLRSRGSYAAVWTLSRLAGNAVVRHDGPLSVRRAFLPEELDALARDAGLTYLRAHREPWFRVSLAGEKPE